MKVGISNTAAPRKRLRILRRPSESIRPSTPRPQRRDCHGRLGAALVALAGSRAGLGAGAGCDITDAGFRPWCSATFVGAQHRFTLRFTGPDARERAEAMAAMLPEAELSVPGHIAADAAVDMPLRNAGEDWLIDLTILTIEDW